MASGAWNRAVLTGITSLDPQAAGDNPFNAIQGKSSGSAAMKYDPKVLQATQESGLFGG